MKALLVSGAFVAMVVADVASGTERGDDRMVVEPGMIGPPKTPDEVGATDRESVPKGMEGRGRDGTSAPSGARGDNDPEGEYTADGDNAAIAAGPYIRWKGRSGDDGAPAAQGDSAQARAPPALLPATRTDPGA